MITNYPDKYVVVEITDQTHGTFRKILGSWHGGYLGSDSYRLSSAIKEFSETEDSYEFITETSMYVCKKNSHGMNLIATSVYANLIDHAKSVGSAVRIIDDF